MDRESLLCQRRKVCSFLLAGLANRHASAKDGSASVGHTVSQNLLVQCVQITGHRYRHEQVAPVPSQLALDAAFFVAAGRVAVLAQIAPMGAEGDDPIRLDPLISAQNLLHHRLHVVIAQGLENPAKVVESVLVGFEQRLLRGVWITNAATGAKAAAVKATASGGGGGGGSDDDPWGDDAKQAAIDAKELLQYKLDDIFDCLQTWIDNNPGASTEDIQAKIGEARTEAKQAADDLTKDVTAEVSAEESGADAAEKDPGKSSDSDDQNTADVPDDDDDPGEEDYPGNDHDLDDTDEGDDPEDEDPEGGDGGDAGGEGGGGTA